MEESPPALVNHLLPLIEYSAAFFKSRKAQQITQKEFAQKINWREADVSKTFRYLRGITDQAPDEWRLELLLEFLLKHCVIESGTLRFKDQAVSLNTNPVILHKNYEEAQVGKAVQAAGPQVCLINTYLASDLLNTQLAEDNPNTLMNWVRVQQKKVRIIILRPDGKGMMLRSRTRLSQSGVNLAGELLRQLEMVLELQQEMEGGSLEIKMMDEIPGAAAVILDTRVFYGLHLSFGHTEKSAWYELTDPQHPSFQNFRDHFDTLWNDPERTTMLTWELLEHYKRALTILRLEPDFLSDSTWKIHLHDMAEVTQGNRAARFFDTTGTLSEWQLKITRPERSIYLMAELSILGQDGRLGKSRLITEKLVDRDYAHARFTDFDHLSVHLSFHCRMESREEPFMLGYFIISAAGDSCSGYIVLQNITLPEQQCLPLPDYYQRLLRFRDSSYFSLQRTRMEMANFQPKGIPHAGTYRVYSYGGQRGSQKCIKVNWLQINAYGEARYKNQRFNSFSGRATYIDDNLHFVFTHYQSLGRLRRSYLILSMRQYPPETDSFYSGVHLGVSENPSMPIGKRFLVEYVQEVDFDTVEAYIIPLHGPEYRQLDEALRKLLSGRIKNLLGFLRQEGNIKDLIDIEKEWEHSIKLNEIFYDSALRYVGLGEYKTAAKMILRAVNHGFDNMAEFENTIGSEALKSIRETRDYKVIEQIFGHI
ncbi:MAG: hypothetical protein ABIO24_01890 [Saprospiraceae bacterium]